MEGREEREEGSVCERERKQQQVVGQGSGKWNLARRQASSTSRSDAVALLLL